jgi:hypothetical protein
MDKKKEWEAVLEGLEEKNEKADSGGGDQGYPCE